MNTISGKQSIIFTFAPLPIRKSSKENIITTEIDDKIITLATTSHFPSGKLGRLALLAIFSLLDTKKPVITLSQIKSFLHRSGFNVSSSYKTVINNLQRILDIKITIATSSYIISFSILSEIKDEQFYFSQEYIDYCSKDLFPVSLSQYNTITDPLQIDLTDYMHYKMFVKNIDHIDTPLSVLISEFNSKILSNYQTKREDIKTFMDYFMLHKNSFAIDTTLPVEKIINILIRHKFWKSIDSFFYFSNSNFYLSFCPHLTEFSKHPIHAFKTKMRESKDFLNNFTLSTKREFKKELSKFYDTLYAVIPHILLPTSIKNHAAFTHEQNNKKKRLRKKHYRKFQKKM